MLRLLSEVGLEGYLQAENEQWYVEAEKTRLTYMGL